MRKLLTIIISVLVSCYCMVILAASSPDTKITLNCVNQSVEQVLKEIEKQSGLNIVYKSGTAKKWPKISLSVTDKPAAEVIKIVAAKVGENYKIQNNIVTIGEETPVRLSRTITGVVTDDEGEPLAGASIILQGTNNGTSTNVDGEFNLKVDADSPVLQVSYIGMKTSMIALTSKNTTGTLKIVLEPNVAIMGEVVVTGYQEIKKEKMTGAVTTISSDKLEERYTPNLLDNLEGRVAGLSTYGGQPVIRGTGTLYGTSAPLLVVDGLPVESSISDLNPYDIESVNVLKDAAASAIYGARAANGIIVVTTKNARSKGKVDIAFSSDITMYEKANVDYADNFYMTPEEQVNAESKYYDYYFFNNNGEIKNPLSSTETSINNGHQISPVRYAYYQLAKGEISQSELDQRLASLKKNNFAKDYADEVYRRQVIQQYNLALRSSNDIMRNNFVINYKHDNSGIINSSNNFLNISYKGSFDLAKWVTASVGINGVYANTQEAGYDATSGHTNIWALPAYTPFYNSDNSLIKQYYSFNGNEYRALQEGMEDLGVDIVDEFYANVSRTRRQNMRYHADLLFKIIPGLTANAQFTYEVENTQVKWEADKSSHLARSMRNAYTYKDSKGVLKKYVPDSGGMLQTSNKNGNYWTARGQLNYTRTFLDKHDITAIAGLEFRETKKTGTYSLALGYDDQLQNSMTATTDFGTLSNLNYSPYFICSTRTSTSTMYPAKSMVYLEYFQDALGIDVENHHRYASGYANFTYTFDNRYNVFGSYRKDYADVYGLNSKFRGQPLWSVGAGWNAHNEEFLRDYTWINFLKLRYSYGVTGNIYQGASSFMTATTTDINGTTHLPEGRVKSPANPYLRWEQNRTSNVGVDFSFLNYRLRGSFDFYNKSGKDIFAQKTLDPTSGFSKMNGNVASIRNRGVELVLAYDWFIPKDKGFGWTTSFTFTHNKNIVTEVENPAKSASEQLRTPFVKDYPVSALWCYRFAGISDQPGEEGQVLWYTEDGKSKMHKVSTLSPEVLEYGGQTEPKVIMGMENTFRWNGLRLGITMAYYGGHQMRALAERELYGIPDGPIASYFNNAWTPENHTTTPGLGQYGCQSNSSISSETYYSNTAVYDADFLKIRNVVLSYDLPARWLRNIGISACQVRFQLNDPKAIWTKNKVSVDPETLGLRGRSSYVFGLNLNL